MKKRLTCLFVAVIMIFMSSVHPVQAARAQGGDRETEAGTGQNQGTRTVRVAYPIQAGLTDVDEQGNYTGYTYEYLQEVAQYTGWDYEFVEVPGDINDSLSALMEMLENGEIDLMGGMVYNEATGQMFDYSSQSYGVRETVLQVLYDTVDNKLINSQVEQSFRIAAPITAKQTRAELEDFCEMNLVTPEYVDCVSVEEQLQALKDGRADMMVNSSMNYIEGVKTVARFSPKPFYFVTTKGKNAELLDELNAAMMNIEQVNPYFSNMLYEKYFSYSEEKLVLSDEEERYVEHTGPLRVGVLSGQAPYQYQKEDGSLGGISIDLLDYVTENTGLKFEFVCVDTPEELYERSEKNEIDLVAGMPYDYDLAKERHLSMSQAYVSSQYVILMNEKCSEDDIGSGTLALTSSGYYGGEHEGEVAYYNSTDECIRAVAKGKADYTCVDAYTAQYFVNLPQYANLKLIPQAYKSREICFGIVKPGPQELISVLNKIILLIPEEEMQKILIRNTVQKQSFSVQSFIKANPLETIGLVAGILMLIILFLLYFLRQRARMSKQMALELKKHFRVYGLVNEYFLEYSFRDNKTIVSAPSKESSRPRLIVYDHNKAESNEDEEKQKEIFYKILSSCDDGVHELQLYFEGGCHWVRIAVETVFDGETPAYTLGKLNIIDEEKQEKDILLQKAQLDSLTHIYNSETLRKQIEEALAALHEGERGALLLFDVDNFKNVNDTYGHMQGDWALIQVAELLKVSFRSNDIVGRPGGDEFTVYMNSIKNRQILMDKCQFLCEKVRELKLEDGKGLTISLGAVLASRGDTYDELYTRADKALYQAKEKGRDRYQIWETDTEDK
ncbi:transporter substrate-binding domain-containing diguanylate cyclase [Qiania dongpingensis]|uniref:Transporter substrate-binding domain-containing protein n=1 Tax=Qiania dongpingensis TaxID=2763669 RepID=A0A7G9G1E3_9FIRM|nr:transporter substrate-binding domain-containing protein [Qiania dongpingensis]QNM04625.1 transporter substrate-binding domain-containing protein [Qiania dongpingensis]